jgi:uncharacterized membrane protein YccC
MSIDFQMIFSATNLVNIGIGAVIGALLLGSFGRGWRYFREQWKAFQAREQERHTLRLSSVIRSRNSMERNREYLNFLRNSTNTTFHVSTIYLILAMGLFLKMGTNNSDNLAFVVGILSGAFISGYVLAVVINRRARQVSRAILEGYDQLLEAELAENDPKELSFREFVAAQEISQESTLTEKPVKK